MSDPVLSDGDRAVLAELRALREAVTAAQPTDEQARRDVVNAALRVIRGQATAAPRDLAPDADLGQLARTAFHL